MWVTLDWRIIKTRASHRCCGCWRTFPPGVEMRVSVGMWEGDPPDRVYYCLVCDRFIRDMDFASDEPFPSDCWVTLDDHGEQYAKTEAGLTGYIAAARVPTAREQLALGNMYNDLRLGKRWREFEKRRNRHA